MIGELCAGLSLKSQELTAMFLAVRLYCSVVMEYDIHTLLDLATLVTTLWVIYMIRFNLKSSYMEDKDNFAIYYVVSFSISPLFLSHCSENCVYIYLYWSVCVWGKINISVIMGMGINHLYFGFPKSSIKCCNFTKGMHWAIETN